MMYNHPGKTQSKQRLGMKVKGIKFAGVVHSNLLTPTF
jgi:hypothetical protein